MKKFVAIAWLFAAFGLQAQDTISVEGNTLFSSVANQIKPGTTVLFGPNATLIVTEGMTVQGTEEARVIFQSADQDAPGRGIVFQVTSSRGGLVSLKHVMFKQLERRRHDMMVSHQLLSLYYLGAPMVGKKPLPRYLWATARNNVVAHAASFDKNMRAWEQMSFLHNG